MSGAIVLVAAGVRAELYPGPRAPALPWAARAACVVDEHLRTSDPSIWAAGDMNEIVHKVSGRTVRVPMAGPANRQGRIAASNALGMSMKYSGALGSSVVKIFDAVAASTGLTESAARAAGFDAAAAVVVKDHHASYYPGGKELVLKLVYDRSSGRLLGGQAFGEEGVEKRIDALAAALHGKMTLQRPRGDRFRLFPALLLGQRSAERRRLRGTERHQRIRAAGRRGGGAEAAGGARNWRGRGAARPAGRAQPQRVRDLARARGAEHPGGRASVPPGRGAAGSPDPRPLPIGVPLAPGACVFSRKTDGRMCATSPAATSR